MIKKTIPDDDERVDKSETRDKIECSYCGEEYDSSELCCPYCDEDEDDEDEKDDEDDC